MVDVCAEAEVRDLSAKTFVPLPKEYWDNKKTVADIFDAIAAANDPKIKEEQVKKSLSGRGSWKILNINYILSPQQQPYLS